VAIAVLSVAGLPSLSGYGARTLLLESLMQGGSITHQILLAGVLLATAMGLAAVARLMLGLLAHHQLTVGAEPNLPETGHSLAAPDVPTQAHVAHNLPGNGNRASWWNRAPIFTLAAASVILGIPSHWLSTGFFTRFAVDSLGVPLSAVQTATPSWTYPVSTVLLFASFGLGVLIHVARSDSATVAAVPSLAAVRGFASRLSLLSPLTSRYWQLVDKGAFDFYPAISTFLGGFARIAAFVVYVSAGRSAR
jgi:NADH:ubiquinone oxidoreductase subunit 5 (subunit L)/multisubunit Na+/H+ antiporter MnhA subunit